ncbi:hypothetical protein IFT84_13105 [Rhizobium sp. CFBP 8762]|uniref:hypothetical protein n=1 Tax=Rhizobium sp. CFBP 8762 TaxID=2775279 RepID=UPI0017811E11|nr:hypothetical protein [Rhizobium sp. CFBP 8762]MBD8555443.1 hypothetical protein [Rhizobium sp. CFBP 8762]
MSVVSINQNQDSERIVAVMLNGGRVTYGFRSALFSASARAGISINEYVLQAAAEKLAAAGATFPGLFSSGDCRNDATARGAM